MDVTPIGNSGFGAIVNNVRITALSDQQFEDIYAAFLRFGFLVFHNQFLTAEENIAFGERFGALEFGALPIANQKRKGNDDWGDIFSKDSRQMRTNIGNETWHTDSTYMPISSKCGLLSAVKVPAVDGETELADMRAGYAALDDATKARISALSAYHSTQYSQARDLGDFVETGTTALYHGEAYLRPLVKTHPETGDKCLFVGRHAFAIPGLTRAESQQLLASLTADAVSDESRVYRHQWSEGDTLLWDNRALLHRARPYDYSEPRVMIATRVAGDAGSELAYYPDDPQAEVGRKVLAEELDVLRLESADA